MKQLPSKLMSPYRLRRDHLYDDMILLFSKEDTALNQPFSVYFVGEKGIDTGGSWHTNDPLTEVACSLLAFLVASKAAPFEYWVAFYRLGTYSVDLFP